tara:strand:- start:642 stop:758 length:117 start_codon:yes stop_codon:yes gene_type:complete
MLNPNKSFNNPKDSLDEEYTDDNEFEEVSEVLENEDEI